MAVYIEKQVIRSTQCDLNGELKASSLLEMLQDAANSHSCEYGVSQLELMKKGALWIVVKQSVEIRSAARYGEEIVIETWPGKPRVALLPRFYRVLSVGSEVLAEGLAWWAIISSKTRTLASPNTLGIELPWEVRGCETAMPRRRLTPEPYGQSEFTVPWSYCDLNGHMNNCKYLDLCEDVLRQQHIGKRLCAFTVEHSGEALPDQKLHLTLAKDDTAFYVSAQSDQPVFTAVLKYTDRDNKEAGKQ